MPPPSNVFSWCTKEPAVGVFHCPPKVLAPTALSARNGRSAHETENLRFALRQIHRHDPCDTVDGHLSAVGDSARRVGDAEHHRDAALARERREVRGAAAAFGDDPRDARPGWPSAGPATRVTSTSPGAIRRARIRS